MACIFSNRIKPLITVGKLWSGAFCVHAQRCLISCQILIKDKAKKGSVFSHEKKLYVWSLTIAFTVFFLPGVCFSDINVGICGGYARYSAYPLGNGNSLGIELDFVLSPHDNITIVLDRYSKNTAAMFPVYSTMTVKEWRSQLYVPGISFKRTILKINPIYGYLGGGVDFYLFSRYAYVLYDTWDWGFPDSYISDGFDWWPGLHLLGGMKVKLNKLPLSLIFELRMNCSSPPNGTLRGAIIKTGLIYTGRQRRRIYEE